MKGIFVAIFAVAVGATAVWADDDPIALEQPAQAVAGVLGSLTVEVSRERVVSSKHEILIVSLGAVLLMLGVATLLASRLARDITVPLLGLEGAWPP